MGAIILLLLKTLSMDEAYKSINWPVIFLIALLIPVGTAMNNTGAANYLSEFIIYLSTNLCSQNQLFLTNNNLQNNVKY